MPASPSARTPATGWTPRGDRRVRALGAASSRRPPFPSVTVPRACRDALRLGTGFVVLVLVGVAPLTGQAVSGVLAGRVSGPGGEPLPAASVSVVSERRGLIRAALTNSRGAFSVAGLPPGPYRIRIDLIGRRSVALPAVEVELGRTTWIGDVALEVAAVSVEPLAVELERPRIDPTRTSIGAVLSADEFRNLPTGRDSRSIVELMPQANESFLGDPVNVGGSTGLENVFYVEGIEVTDVYRGRTGTRLPYDFIEAVQLETGGYEAEYGGALGGIVNVVTRSGTDTFRASGFGYVTGSGLAADPRAVPGVQQRFGMEEFDVGVSLSGPIARGRLWYFTAYNPAFVREDVSLPGLEPEEATVTRHAFAAKFDWRASPAADVALTVLGDPTTERRIEPPSGSVRLLNPDPILGRHREGSLNGSLRGTFRLGRGTVLEAAVSRHQAREDVEGATALGRREPAFLDRRDPPSIFLSGGHRADQEIGSARTTARIDVARDAEGHRIKAGARYQHTRLETLRREDPGQIVRRADALFEASFFLQDFAVQSRVVTLYLQDTWAVTERLRILPGVRWEGQYLIDQQGALGQSIGDQWQPRLGFTYRLASDGADKLFGHAGRFYQRLPLFWSSLALGGTDQRQAFYADDPRTGDVALDSVRVFADPAEIRGGVEDLAGEHHDALVLGYERAVGSTLRVGARGIHRRLRASVTSAFTPDAELTGGNPGRGALDHLPDSKRTYTALELTLDHRSSRLTARWSYVLSRTRGNYPGLYAADAGGLRGGSLGPNNDQLTYFPAQQVDAEGLLPQDRTHVMKLNGAYRVATGLTVGTSIIVQSGTPLSEFGRVPSGFNTPLFLAPRGSEGRSPAVWNLDLRFAYDLPSRPSGRIVLDVLHLGNPQEAVRFDQRRFNTATGSPFASYEELVSRQRGERESFGTPIAFQPPLTLRLGLEVAVQP